MIGSCLFDYWDVEVEWNEHIVYYVRFKPRFTGKTGQIPESIRLFLAGKASAIPDLTSHAIIHDGVYSTIYQRVLQIPYGHTESYGSIARDVGTGPRVVGLAMKRNPTPLIIPCHRVIGKKGLGGYTPDITIKEKLLALEKENRSDNR
jgi:methylated-DNA-[protein]-cysteine S-methyltransferase